MRLSNELMQELSTLIEETGERIAEDYYLSFFEFLAQLNVPDTDCPIPLKLWTAIAQALADASHYRAVGHCEVAGADPALFVQPADD